MDKTKQCIERSQSIHIGERSSPIYDYSKTIYVKCMEPIIVICKLHGEFRVTPNNHYNGRGCPHKECIKDKISKANKYTTETFIEKANIIHNGRYDYSNVDYIDTYTDVCIICVTHGEFWQTPNNHIKGHGCRECGFDRSFLIGVKRRGRSPPTTPSL